MTSQARGLIALIYLLPALAVAQQLPRADQVPGGIALVELGVNADQPMPRVRYLDRQISVLNRDGRWLAMVGIPLDTTPGTQALLVDDREIEFQVNEKEYATQHLTITNTRQVNPNEQDMERITAERVRINKALASWSNSDPMSRDFVAPVNGERTSSFGLRRFFNGEPRNPHSGMDIDGNEGDPIVSPSAGTVVETGDFFFNGNTVFVDHGQGLVTMYCHLSRIDVMPGQSVEAGDTLGLVGSTGRVTGPHLHWSVSLNQAMVNPGLFLSTAPLTAD
jgi:murein DD-endopeptidase MepM/ murein hydrolase activator NlpD